MATRCWAAEFLRRFMPEPGRGMLRSTCAFAPEELLNVARHFRASFCADFLRLGRAESSLPWRGSRMVARHFSAGWGHLKRDPSRRDGREAWTPDGCLRRLTVSARGPVATEGARSPFPNVPTRRGSFLNSHPALKCRATTNSPSGAKMRVTLSPGIPGSKTNLSAGSDPLHDA